jgi:phosphoethanolamine N-methyltransferase
MELEDPVYCLKNVPLFETLYGKNLISLGGTKAIDNMFIGVDIKKQKALDLGFGLGGVAFYLAKKFSMNISGIEVHPWMVKYATEQAPKDLIHSLAFHVYDEQGNIPFARGSFDLVYSKGVLNHVKNKKDLFQKVQTVLKPKGLFIIADWIYPQIKQEPGPLVFETKQSYSQVLEETGFNINDFKDDSIIFLSYIKTFLENMSRNRDHIESKFGKEIFVNILEQHYQLIEDIDKKQKFAIRIIAST